MSKAVVVYFSGYGHTKRVAQAAAEGAQASLVEIDSEGNIPEAAWDLLDQAQSILFGAPTYMGSVPWQFKKFADATSRKWFVRQWQDKVFGGFTNSASLNGDKQVSLILMHTLASQHGGIWAWLPPTPRPRAARISTTSAPRSARWCSRRPTRMPRPFPAAISRP